MPLTRVAFAPMVIRMLPTVRPAPLPAIMVLTTRASPPVALVSNVRDTIAGPARETIDKLVECMWLISAGRTSPLLPVTVVVITVPRNGAIMALFRLTDVNVSPLLPTLAGNPDAIDIYGALAQLELLMATGSLKLSPPVTDEMVPLFNDMFNRVNVAPDEHVSVLLTETPLLVLLVRGMVPASRAMALGSAQSVFVGTRALGRHRLALKVVVVIIAPNADFGGHSREAVWPSTGPAVLRDSMLQPSPVRSTLRSVSRPGLQSGASITVRTWLAPGLTVIVVLLASLRSPHVVRRTPGLTDALTPVFPPLRLANSDPNCR